APVKWFLASLGKLSGLFGSRRGSQLCVSLSFSKKRERRKVAILASIQKRPLASGLSRLILVPVPTTVVCARFLAVRAACGASFPRVGDCVILLGPGQGERRGRHDFGSRRARKHRGGPARLPRGR